MRHITEPLSERLAGPIGRAPKRLRRRDVAARARHEVRYLSAFPVLPKYLDTGDLILRRGNR